MADLMKLVDKGFKEMDKGQSPNLETAYLQLLDYSIMDQSADVGNKAEWALNDQTAAHSDNGELHEMKLQFNPTSLHITGNPRKKKKRRDMQYHKDEKKKHKVSLDEAPHQRQTLSFEFFIDDTSPLITTKSDMEKIDRTQVGKNLLDGYKKGDIYEIVSGYQQLVRNPILSHVAFCYGSFYFEGYIDDIDVEFSMFTREGIPVRAKINLTMKLLDTTET